MTRTRLGALLVALTTILWLAAASPALAAGNGNGNGGGQTKDRDQSAAGKNGQPDPEPTEDTETASRGKNTSCPGYNDEDDGPYDHDSCDGVVGRQGGSGNGKCAGCDGRADDKSPNGQSRNDHNNGYECDNNGGIARGNPAHSRCKAPPPENPPIPPRPPRTPRDIGTPSLPEEPETVLGLRVPKAVPAVRPQRERAGVLPFTGPGAALQGFTVLGLGLMLAGTTLLVRRKNNTR